MVYLSLLGTRLTSYGAAVHEKESSKELLAWWKGGRNQKQNKRVGGPIFPEWNLPFTPWKISRTPLLSAHNGCQCSRNAWKTLSHWFSRRLRLEICPVWTQGEWPHSYSSIHARFPSSNRMMISNITSTMVDIHPTSACREWRVTPCLPRRGKSRLIQAEKMFPLCVKNEPRV